MTVNNLELLSIGSDIQYDEMYCNYILCI